MATNVLSQDQIQGRFRSNWFAIILYGVEGIPLLVITLAIVLGLLP